jgi:O-methyltransferase
MDLGRHILRRLSESFGLLQATQIYLRYRAFTMIPWHTFASNIVLCKERAPETGCVVEAGVWRGGMSAGIADALPGRLHYLFDSFQGLPPAEQRDGRAALEWQSNTSSPSYYDNCSAEQSFAERAMAKAAAREIHVISGWFEDTLPTFVPKEPIAILRLDADWYASTIQCLTNLYPHVMEGGLIILDDYYSWDGCARALHDYLSAHKSVDRIRQGLGGICYLVKSSTESFEESR